MRRQISGWSRLMPVSLLLVVFIALGMAVTGCSDSSSNATGTQQNNKSGVIRGGVNAGDVAFEYRVASAGDPANPIEGPFAIRGRNIRYDSGALIVDLSVVNLSANTHTGPVSLTFLSLLPADVTVGNPDGDQHGVGATVTFEFADGDQMWAPNEESLGRATHFVVGSGVSIGFVAQLNGASNGLGAIGGMVWNDANGDGIMDTTEAPVEGAAVSLDMEGMTTQMATSGADGMYRFDDLAAGFYTVGKVPDSTSTVTTGNPIYVTLVASDSVVSSFLAANFGVQYTAGPPGDSTGDSTSDSSNAVSGMAFEDLNNNHMWDEGEPGLGGVEVKMCLWQGSNQGPMPTPLDLDCQSTVTDSTGMFSFENLQAGIYVATSSKPEGFDRTTFKWVVVDVDADSSGNTINFGFKAGEGDDCDEGGDGEGNGHKHHGHGNGHGDDDDDDDGGGGIAIALRRAGVTD